jgi:hypothetical protein
MTFAPKRSVRSRGLVIFFVIPGGNYPALQVTFEHTIARAVDHRNSQPVQNIIYSSQSIRRAISEHPYTQLSCKQAAIWS